MDHVTAYDFALAYNQRVYEDFRDSKIEDHDFQEFLMEIKNSHSEEDLSLILKYSWTLGMIGWRGPRAADRAADRR